MSWAFAKINGRLAEIFFDEKKQKKYPRNPEKAVWAHCYVKADEYKTKQEQRWIKIDTKTFRFSWRNQKYSRVKN